MPHDGPKAGSKRAANFPHGSKGRELKRPSAKAEGRRQPPFGSSDFNTLRIGIRNSLRSRAQWPARTDARPKSAARREATPCALADGGGEVMSDK